MLFPAVYGEKNFFDDLNDFEGFPWKAVKHDPLFGKNASRLMKTDVRELADAYEFDSDLPGFRKEEISAELHDGYLTVSAAKSVDGDVETKKGQYLRRERCTGSCSRSFFVGEAVKEGDVSAKYENGILMVTVPKKEVVPQKHSIMIQ